MKFSTFFKTILITSLLCIANSAFANVTNKRYVGFNMGALGNSYELDGTVTPQHGTGKSENTDKSFNAAVLGLYVGDEIDINRYSIAMELSGAINIGDDEGDSSAEFKTPASIAISILPGYYLTPRNHVFGRIGYMETGVDADGDGDLGYTFPGLLGNLPGMPGWLQGDTISGNDFSVGGAIVGLGYEYAITKHVSLRAEYDHVTYNNQSDAETTQNHVTYEGEFNNLKQNIVTAGLNYKF